jgi:hypothetical protein
MGNSINTPEKRARPKIERRTIRYDEREKQYALRKEKPIQQKLQAESREIVLLSASPAFAY